MIDIHCHILPSIDDGARSRKESLEMCRMAAADGITTIVATPHFKAKVHEPSSSKVFALLRELNQDIQDAGLDLKILHGADLAICPETKKYIDTVEHLRINNTRYFLAELPHELAPPGWDDFLLSLIEIGYRPILTHPERNPSFIRNPEIVIPFVKGGGLVQITGGSILGEFGSDIQNTARELLRAGFVHVIATDAHSTDFRAPLLSKAVAEAGKIIDQEDVTAMVTTVPEAIINGRELPLDMFIKNNKKSWLSRLLK
jgi:protein-tyrosine phosphatase